MQSDPQHASDEDVEIEDDPSPAKSTPVAEDALSLQEIIKRSSTHPKFLHSNSTSHVWAFGAIAELIDNSCDPDVKAARFDIDFVEKPQPMLVFSDDGAGMAFDRLHKMLSFGYCDKVEIDGHKPIGHYGNGFKSGSMRLGKDAIVFTKHESGLSVGLLSQTFLAAVQADAVLVPMATWNHKRQLQNESESRESLRVITQHSPFDSDQLVLDQFDHIKATGTRIVIYNLRRESGQLEFDLDDDPKDIRIRGDVAAPSAKHPERAGLRQRYNRQQSAGNDIPIDYSLREYCSVLYLRPRMKIYIRGHVVRTKLIEKSLNFTKVDVYNPQVNGRRVKDVKITYGLNAMTDKKDAYGMMLYYRNRLIKPYLKVGLQLQQNYAGKGVVGVIEADFLQPTHNKQDFDFTTQFRSCVQKLGEGLKTYWRELKQQQARERNLSVAEDDDDFEMTVPKLPDMVWAQCDDCLKWRKLGTDVDPDTLPEKWYCRMNTYNPVRASCDVPQDPDQEEEDQDLRVSRKRQRAVDDLAQQKQQADLAKRTQEKRQRQEEEERRKQEEIQRKEREVEQERRLLEYQQREFLRQREDLVRRAREVEMQQQQMLRAKRDPDAVPAAGATASSAPAPASASATVSVPPAVAPTVVGAGPTHAAASAGPRPDGVTDLANGPTTRSRAASVAGSAAASPPLGTAADAAGSLLSPPPDGRPVEPDENPAKRLRTLLSDAPISPTLDLTDMAPTPPPAVASVSGSGSTRGAAVASPAFQRPLPQSQPAAYQRGPLALSQPVPTPTPPQPQAPVPPPVLSAGPPGPPPPVYVPPPLSAAAARPPAAAPVQGPVVTGAPPPRPPQQPAGPAPLSATPQPAHYQFQLQQLQQLNHQQQQLLLQQQQQISLLQTEVAQSKLELTHYSDSFGRSEAAHQQTLGLLTNIGQKLYDVLRSVDEGRMPAQVTPVTLAALDLDPFLALVRTAMQSSTDLRQVRGDIRSLMKLLNGGVALPVSQDNQLDLDFRLWVERQVKKATNNGASG